MSTVADTWHQDLVKEEPGEETEVENMNMPAVRVKMEPDSSENEWITEDFCDILPEPTCPENSILDHYSVIIKEEPLEMKIESLFCVEENSCDAILPDPGNCNSAMDTNFTSLPTSSKTEELNSEGVSLATKARNVPTAVNSLVVTPRTPYLSNYVYIEPTYPSVICEVCGREFDFPCLLKAHRRVHTGERPYKCEHCNKTYRNSRDLVNHRRRHTGERPYKCKFCTKDFTCSSGLSDHNRSYHAGERPFKCDVCFKTFRLSGNLVLHYQMHVEKRTCEFCVQTFSSLGALLSHRSQHTVQKPHKCDDCCQQFSLSFQLSEHRRTHYPDEPFECRICKERFGSPRDWLKHRRTHKTK